MIRQSNCELERLIRDPIGRGRSADVDFVEARVDSDEVRPAVLDDGMIGVGKRFLDFRPEVLRGSVVGVGTLRERLGCIEAEHYPGTLNGSRVADHGIPCLVHHFELVYLHVKRLARDGGE